MWYTQWKYNRLEELGLIEWEELNEACLNKYIPHEKKEVKVEEFINLKQGNMSVEEYSLKFSMLYRYSPSLVSDPKDEMSCFAMGVANLVREECRTTRLYDDMALSRLMLYALSIEESKFKKSLKVMKNLGVLR